VDNYKPEVPRSFKLKQNLPNPFNNETTIKYYLKEETIVEIKIYNIKSQKVKLS